MKRTLCAMAMLALPLAAQIADNKSLNGKYFFRHVSILAGANGAVTDARTGWGTMTFDGSGSLSFQGSQIAGANPAAALTGTGSYSVKPGAFATLANPLRAGSTINARVGANGTVVGSTTEAATTFEMFIAVPAPAQATSAGTLSGSYWVSSLELPNGSSSLLRNTWFKLTSNGNGAFGDAAVTGEAVNLGNRLLNLAIPGVTYTVASDGSGTLNLPMPGAADFSGQLIGGVKTIYVAPDGSFFIGGSTANAVHGFVIGVRAYAGNAQNASFTGLYWSAGMRLDGARLSSFAGEVRPTGAGQAVWHRRVRQIEGPVDFTPLLSYNLTSDGSGRTLTGKIALAATGASFAGVNVSDTDSASYELFFGVRAPDQSGSGVFLNPQGVVNAASFAPSGTPVAPGQMVSAFGSGMASGTFGATTIPFPNTLGGVSVTVNGQPAPIFLAKPTQLNFLIPSGVTGNTATIVVTNNNVKSNSVDVPLAASSPGIFTVAQSGIGAGVFLHADFSVVSAASPARRGETILVFLTGLGLTSPRVADGNGSPSNPPSVMTADMNVFIGSTATPAAIAFKGLAPQLIGLGQLNITIPANAPTGTVGLSIQTAEAFNDMVDINIAP